MAAENRDAAVALAWADGDYTFRLPWAQLVELQEKTDSGPYMVLDRLLSGRWKVQDISEVIRLGLIGGGKDPITALKLVRRYVEERPPIENIVIAQQVLGAAVVGAPEEEVEKKSEAPAQEVVTNSLMESSE